MTALSLGAVAALVYVLGWLRGYQSYKEGPERLRQLRDEADQVATAALKRVVALERDAERLLRDWHRMRGWLVRIRTAAAGPEYLRELAVRAMEGKDPESSDPIEVRP